MCRRCRWVTCQAIRHQQSPLNTIAVIALHSPLAPLRMPNWLPMSSGSCSAHSTYSILLRGTFSAPTRRPRRRSSQFGDLFGGSLEAVGPSLGGKATAGQASSNAPLCLCAERCHSLPAGLHDLPNKSIDRKSQLLVQAFVQREAHAWAFSKTFPMEFYVNVSYFPYRYVTLLTNFVCC